MSGTIGVEIFNRDVYLFDYIPTRVDPTASAIIVLSGFIAVFLFTLGPAWRASRIDPIQSLRWE